MAPAAPSATLGDEIDSGNGSSFVIVPVPFPAVADTLASCGLYNSSTTVSSGSYVSSPCTSTVTDLVVTPSGKSTTQGRTDT